MKLPKGFGKNYFTLNAITVTVNLITLKAIEVSMQQTYFTNIKEEKEDDTSQEEFLDILCPLQLSTKACHCNCYFLRFTRKTLKLFNAKKLFFNYFKTLNNSISPPSFLYL